MIKNLHILVWPDKLGPVASKNREPLKADLREPEKEWVGYAGVHVESRRDSIGEAPRGRRVRIMVDREEGQSVVRVTHLGFINNRGVWNVRPAPRAHSSVHGKQRLVK